MAGNANHTPYVDADCRKDPAHAEPAHQSLVAGGVVCDCPRADDVCHAIWAARLSRSIFDFIDHQLVVRTSDGAIRTFSLGSRSVADFYRELMATLHTLGIDVKIWTTPVEVMERIPFEEDDLHASYDAEYASRCWRIMAQTDRILKRFRSSFIGKCSPVHFFWGAFDMAVTRFSGRRAPQHPGGVPALADFVVREAYSHEVSSCGFWPGGGAIPEPAFYAYAYPEPAGFKEAPISPKEAFYSSEMSEFILPYEVVRKADQPEPMLLAFLQSTYEAAANLGKWDRTSLERPPGPLR